MSKESVVTVGMSDAKLLNLATAPKEGLLIVLACHVVYEIGSGKCYAEHESDAPIYEAQLRYAFKHFAWRLDAKPVMTPSGGPTKKPTRSEGASYIDWARTLGIAIPNDVISEDYALTTSENLLFSVYRYHQHRGMMPAAIDVISWGFKARRFAATLDAINKWGMIGATLPSINFFPVGNLYGSFLNKVQADEDNYIKSLQHGLDHIYSDSATAAAIARRDPHDSRSSVRSFYAGYPMPF